jgi:proline racemase
MGNNTIIFLQGQQIPKGKELDVALEILKPQVISGHDVGIIYPPTLGGDLKVKIVGLTSRAFITACGGLTQVVGKVLVETDFARFLPIPIHEPQTRIVLETDGGNTQITVEVARGKAVRVWTDMRSFVDECYDMGVASIDLNGVEAWKIGKFLVIDGDKVKKAYPEVALENLDDRTKQVLLQLQDEFKKLTSPRNADFSVYDWNPKNAGDLRVVFPHDLRTGHVEPACGTGFVATSVSVWEMGELQNRGMIEDGEVCFQYECGGAPVLGGSEYTQIHMKSDGEKVTDVKFSHNVIEILEQGRITL